MNIDYKKDTLSLIELHTFYLADGGILRLNNSCKDISFNGNMYSAAVITRGDIEQTIDNEVSSLDVELGIEALVYRGRNAIQMFKDGLFDNARYDLVLYESLQNRTDILFSGYASSEMSGGSFVLKLKIKDILCRLENFQLPRIVYQNQCNNTLFDFGCNLNSDNYKTAAVFQSGNRTNIISATFSDKPDNYYRFGIITAVTGENSGQSRYVLSHTGSAVITDKPFWYDFSLGDQLNIWAGCDKLGTTCRDKFANYKNFAGFEFVPQQDTVLKA